VRPRRRGARSSCTSNDTRPARSACMQAVILAMPGRQNLLSPVRCESRQRSDAMSFCARCAREEFPTLWPRPISRARNWTMQRVWSMNGEADIHAMLAGVQGCIRRAPAAHQIGRKRRKDADTEHREHAHHQRRGRSTLSPGEALHPFWMVDASVGSWHTKGRPDASSDAPR
jgi:hypothetical protein